MKTKGSLQGWDKRGKSPAYWFAVWFGAGLLKPAPGTSGSVAALPVVWMLSVSTHASAATVALSALILWVAITGTRAIDQIERESGVHDAPEIVVDEVAGQWLTCLPILALPDLFSSFWLALGAAFLLFRAFDIAKPWPIRVIDARVAGGWGVMLDDLVAGFMATPILVMLGRGGLL